MDQLIQMYSYFRGQGTGVFRSAKLAIYISYVGFNRGKH